MVGNIDIQTTFGFTFTVLEALTGINDFFSSAYNNFVIMGDFNDQPLDSVMKNFIRSMV